VKQDIQQELKIKEVKPIAPPTVTEKIVQEP
jgi:hypothetical protein